MSTVVFYSGAEMIKQNQKIVNIANIISDAILIWISYFISVFIRFEVFSGTSSIQFFLFPCNIIPVIYGISLVIGYIVLRMYGSHRFKNRMTESINIIFINACGIMAFMSAIYMLKIDNFPRGIVVLYWFFSCITVIGKRFVIRKFLRYKGWFGYGEKHVLVVGNGKLARQYIYDIEQNRHLGIKVIGYIGAEKDNFPAKRQGRYEDLQNILEQNYVDELVVALESHEINFMRTILACAEKEGTRVCLIPFFSEYFPAHVTMETIGISRLINIRATPLDNIFNSTVKRIMDIFGAIILIILTSPLMLVTVIGVRLSSPGKIFFKQKRVGLNKKQFDMLKFRSMRENTSQDTGWSTDQDPRKTKFGSFIRKYSIDELPQLFNVLTGDMSLVGPRPEVPFYVRQFKEDIPLYLVRQQVRPGMTGWAQVNGLRGDTSIEERVKYDIWYIQNWSIRLDIKILLKTAFGGFINNEVVIKKKGKM